MLPTELDAAQIVEELTGVGLSELFHLHLSPRIQAAASLLREMEDAGMTVDRHRLADLWETSLTPSQWRAVYAAESELVLGD